MSRTNNYNQNRISFRKSASTSPSAIAKVDKHVCGPCEWYNLRVTGAGKSEVINLEGNNSPIEKLVFQPTKRTEGPSTKQGTTTRWSKKTVYSVLPI